MDHPHNAVLLLCSSHEKGCSRSSATQKESGRNRRSPQPRNRRPEAPVGANDQESSDRYLETMGLQDSDVGSGVMYQGELLKCPLCRGTVLGYRFLLMGVVPFSGNYRELRRHARRVHPSKRPADVDPRRLREWRHLEHEQEIGDVLSALRSTTPNVVVIGDYVIDGGGHRVLPNQEGGGGGGGGSGEGGARSWRTTLLLLELLGSQFGDAPPRSSSRSWRTNRRPGHRNLWGENLLGLQDEDDDEFLGSAGVPVRQRTRSGRRSPWGDDLLACERRTMKKVSQTARRPWRPAAAGGSRDPRTMPMAVRDDGPFPVNLVVSAGQGPTSFLSPEHKCGYFTRAFS
ncbi:unnamed protein product [Spirodela intermedia]|uniref:Uncharacterized protein n=1 Tax=Spirodela intermedia TaxID=51605 RepID=A0A7I8IC92_SPIIN|nr:unnamed protein product [Spirodela intermedia]CAA6655407.1 unnamed protein product [Spirodela intermedia]